MEKLNKKDLVDIISERAKLSKKDARNAIESAIDAIQESLLKGQEVNITNFGVFTPKVRVGRVGTHPKKHTLIDIKEANTVVFRMSKNLKDSINK